MIRIFVRKFQNKFFVNVYENRNLIASFTWNKLDQIDDIVYSAFFEKFKEYTETKYIDPVKQRESFNRRIKI